MTRNDYLKFAEEVMSEHHYKCLGITDHFEVWRCSRSNTVTWSFDIMISRFGIAVVGDIDSLVFSVGMGYGMSFLAGSDIGYYIHSKLESTHRTEVFDHDLFKWTVGYYLGCWIESNLQIPEPEYDENDDEIDQNIPMVLSSDFDPGVDNIYDIVFDFLISTSDEDFVKYGGVYIDRWDALKPNHFRMSDIALWQEALSEVNYISDVNQAYSFFETYGNVGNWDYCDINITSVCTGLMRRLYLVNYAAKKIMSIKENEEKKLKNRIKKHIKYSIGYCKKILSKKLQWGVQ